MIKKKLSNSEEYLMELLWQTNTPQTSVQLLKNAVDVSWSSNYVHKVLGLLQEKGLIKVCGMEKEGKHYLRQFTPCLSKEEYLSNMLLEQGVGTLSFAKIAMAFVKKGKPSSNVHIESDQQLIAELEDIIARFEEAHKEEH